MKFTIIIGLTMMAGAALAGNDGTDYSANQISFAGQTLLVEIPADPNRVGLELMVSCAAGAIIVLDDAKHKGTPTVFPLAGSSTDGGQGSMYYKGADHTGRVRVYSTNPLCAIPARVW
jgi:hypothetical protein